MTINMDTDQSVQKVIDDVNKSEAKDNITIPMMNGMNTEYANSNKWWGYFPIANILGRKYSNLELSLTRFSIPQMTMGSTTTQFKGYTYEFPTRLIDSDTKEITIDYIVDSKWQNYRSFFKWCSAYEGQINQVISTSDVEQITPSEFIDCRIYLVDHFKNNIISFVFHNCWIKMFGDLALEGNNPEEVHHSVTLCYSNYEIEDI